MNIHEVTTQIEKESPPGGRGILVCVLPPVWNLRAFSLIPLFYGPLLFFCLVLLLFLSSFFCYWPALYFPKSCLFEKWALSSGICVVVFERLGDGCFGRWYVQRIAAMWHWYQLLCIYIVFLLK